MYRKIQLEKIFYNLCLYSIFCYIKSFSVRMSQSLTEMCVLGVKGRINTFDCGFKGPEYVHSCFSNQFWNMPNVHFCKKKYCGEACKMAKANRLWCSSNSVSRNVLIQQPKTDNGIMASVTEYVNNGKVSDPRKFLIRPC